MIRDRYNSLSLDLRVAILIFILTSSIYLIFMDGNMTSSGYFYFLCAQSIISDHDLSIEPELPYGSPVDIRAPKGTDDKKYLYGHIGWPILLLPLTAMGTFLAKFLPYKTLSMLIASTTNCFITALICMLIYLFSRKLKSPPRTSIILSLLYGFTTMAFPYATNSFCEPANTLMLLLSLFWLYSFCQNRSYPLLTLSGLAMGYACFIRIWNIFLLLPGLFLYILLYHLKEEKTFKPFKFLQTSTIFLLPILFMVLLHESYFYFTRSDSYFFGKGSTVPYGINDFVQFKPFSILPTGLYGLLFSTGKGFFFYNPVILFSLFSVRNFYLKHRLETWIFVYVTIAHFIFIGSIVPWSGDVAWGPRYLLPTIPFLVLLLGEWKNSSRKRSLPAPRWMQGLKAVSYKQKLLIVGALAGLIVQIPSLLVDTDLHTVRALSEGIKHEEIFFTPRLSPIIGTWKMLSGKIGSFSKDKPTGLSPWFFRLFDREIHTQGIEIMPISSKLAILVWSAIFGLIFIALGTTLTIFKLIHSKNSVYEE